MTLTQASKHRLRSDVLTAIAVVARNGVIGDGADQPFKFALDWRRFKRRTLGHALIMGRRTYDSIGALPGRVSIVVSRNPGKVTVEERNSVVGSFDEALTVAKNLDFGEIFLIGGGQMYEIGLPYVDVLDITEVPLDAEGQVKFPQIDPTVWKEVSRESHEEFDFVRYERIVPLQP